MYKILLYRHHLYHLLNQNTNQIYYMNLVSTVMSLLSVDPSTVIYNTDTVQYLYNIILYNTVLNIHTCTVSIK